MGEIRITSVGADQWRVEEVDGPFSGASVQPSTAGMRLPEWMVMPARSGSIVDGSIFAKLADQVAERFYQHVTDYLALLDTLKLPKPEDGALVYLARHIDPSLAVTSDTIVDLTSLVIADSFFPDLVVNGKKLMPKERTLGGLLQFLADLHAIFSTQRYVELSIGGLTFNGEVHELGRGFQGIVYAIGDDQVIKIPHANLVGVAKLLIEALVHDFWKYQAVIHPFSVVPVSYTHPLGLFSIRGKAAGKTLEHYLDSVGRHPHAAMVASKREAVWEVIRKILLISREFPWLTLHAYPDNLHIVFDTTGNPHLTLIDFCPPVETFMPVALVNAGVVNSHLGFWPFADKPQNMAKAHLLAALQALGLPMTDIAGKPAILLSSFHLATNFDKYLELADLRRQKRADQTAQTSFQGIEIAEGDVIALSNRDGVSPFIIQLGELSPLDHIGVVVKIDGEWFVAHYTNEKKYHLQPLEKFAGRVVRKQLQYVVGRIPSELNPEQKAKLSLRAQSLVAEQANIQGINCATAVHVLFESMGLDVGARHYYTTHNVDAMGGVLKSIMHYIPDAENGYTPFSIMEMMNIVGHNFADPEKMVRWTEDDFFTAWEREGDVTHIARFLGAHLVHADASSPSFQRYVRMVATKLAAKAMEPDAVSSEPRASGVGQGGDKQGTPEAALATHGHAHHRRPIIRHSTLVHSALSMVQPPSFVSKTAVDISGNLLHGLAPEVVYSHHASVVLTATAHAANVDEFAGGEMTSPFAAEHFVSYHHTPISPLGHAARPIALARNFLGR